MKSNHIHGKTRLITAYITLPQSICGCGLSHNSVPRKQNQLRSFTDWKSQHLNFLPRLRLPGKWPKTRQSRDVLVAKWQRKRDKRRHICYSRNTSFVDIRYDMPRGNVSSKKRFPFNNNHLRRRWNKTVFERYVGLLHEKRWNHAQCETALWMRLIFQFLIYSINVSSTAANAKSSGSLFWNDRIIMTSWRGDDDIIHSSSVRVMEGNTRVFS